MATLKLIAFTLSISSVWVLSLSQNSVPVINNYVIINLCGVDDATSVKSISITESPSATCTVQNDTGDVQTNPCQPNPCLYGGSCITTNDQKDYQCINCPYPMGGKICSELTCSPDCLRVDDKVYHIFANKDKSQYESYLKCQEQNMTLAMIKDKSVHYRIRKQLTLINVDNLEEYYCYWIGLNQTNTLSPWMWIDGTELGTYDDWGNDPFSEYNCGQICRYKIYKITRDRCTGSHGWSYFSFCEKSYPFLKG